MRSVSYWGRRACIFVAAITVLRFLWLLLCPLDLVGDEAYYWDWSRQLDWGYYSKPPMVAWINALSTGILGSHTVAVRLPAVLFGALSMLGIYALASRMFGARTGFWSVVLLAVTPGSVVLNMLMTIDAPFVAFWILALVALWRAVETDARNLRWWLAGGVLTGLGLLTKQMMVVLPIAVMLYLLTTPTRRRHLARIGPYLFLTVAVLALLPVLRWNSQHDWIAFRHTAHHFEADTQSLSDALAHFGHFLGGQLVVLSPLLGLLLGLVACRLVATLPRQAAAASFLVLTGPVPVMFIALASLRQVINPNWPAVFHVAGTILLAAWFTGCLPLSPRIDRARSWLRPAIAVGAAFCLLTYSLPFLAVALRMDGAPHDPTRRLRGWSRFGAEMARILEEQPRPDRTFIMAPRRQVASELAFYIQQRPRVFVWNPEPWALHSQYDIWETPGELITWDGLLLVPIGAPLHFILAARFENVTSLGSLSIPLGSEGEHRFHLYRGTNLKRWP